MASMLARAARAKGAQRGEKTEEVLVVLVCVHGAPHALGRGGLRILLLLADVLLVHGIREDFAEEWENRRGRSRRDS